ncbi:MAG TPA: SRPBCC family protein [Myxococcota bacterium]|nr:SRPBCC family protein [Myxococcota bacterium]
MQIELSQHVAASRERVFDLYSDWVGWTRWAGVKEVVLRQEGDPPPNGLGAIRVIRARGMAIEEEITAFERPARIGYRLIAGAPIREHAGEVRFEAEGTGTRLTWSIRFRPLVPGTGWLLRALLQREIRSVLGGLAEHSGSLRTPAQVQTQAADQ